MMTQHSLTRTQYEIATRLFAAAPAMLQALEWAMPYAESAHQPATPRATYRPEAPVDPSLRQARQALKAAKGEAGR